jgi:phenylacetate-CoA ligase
VSNRALTRELRRLYGSAVIAAHLPGQTRAPYAARATLEQQRDRRLRDTVRYAARAVPFYRDWFAREGIDPRAIRTVGDLARLPILDRDLERSRPELFRADTRRARGALSFATSGSTGRPLRVAHDRISLLANIPWGERERAPVNQLCGTFRPKELYVGYETSTFKKVTAFYADAARLPVTPKRRFVPLDTSAEEVAALLERERPDVLVGYGGWLDLFFRTVTARGLTLRPPKLVMYMGEALPYGARAFIEQHFGVPVLSRYNAVESFKIGFFCEQRSGFHLHEDLCHVRIVDDDGRDLPPGTPGRVLISNLVNRATVLLNHPIGDVAALATASCSCGRTLRLLTELEGRVEDALALDDGRFVHPRSVWQALKDDADVLQYQLVQLEPRRFVLHLATLDDAAFARARDRSLPRLATLLAPDPMIAVERAAARTRDGAVKFRAVVALARPAAD